MNPLREGLSTRAVPQPCAIVIFGATGDLSRRKLLPGLAHLALSALAPDIQVIGLSVNADADNQLAMTKAGAALLLTKEAAVDEIHRAIQLALKGATTAERVVTS